MLRCLQVFLICTIAACSGKGSGGGAASMPGGASTPSNFAVGGTLSGLPQPLAGTSNDVVLVNNGGDPLFLYADGMFHFSKAPTSGSTYNVTVQIQPFRPTGTCVVHNGSGVANAGSLMAVLVQCTVNNYTIGGTVTGLTGSGLVLSNGLGQNSAVVSVSANGPFTFPTPVPSLSSYFVQVLTQPINPGNTCAVSKSLGDVTNSAITNVAVTCLPNIYTVGGTVSGLTGSGLVLAINGGTNLPVAGNGSFTFAAPLLATGTQYTVTVAAQPINPKQTCVVPDSVGTIGNTSITALRVVCSVPRFAYGAGGRGNNILAYTIDFTSGALAPIAGSPYPAGDTTSAIAVDSGYRFLYATNQGATGGAGSNTISAYTINAGSGALSPVPSSPFASASAPVDIAVDPAGRFAYVATLHNNTVLGYAINSVTGALTHIAGGPAEAGIDGPRHLAIDPSGKFLYLSVGNESAIWAYTINTNSGALTAVPGSPFATLSPSSPLTINPNGRFAFVADSGNENGLFNSVLAINPATGALSATFVTYGQEILANAIAVEPGGSYAYALYQYQSAGLPRHVDSLIVGVPFNGDPVEFLALNPAASPLNFSAQLKSISADPSGRFIYVVDANGDAHAYTIDHTNGVLTAATTTTSAFAPILANIVITKQ